MFPLRYAVCNLVAVITLLASPPFATPAPPPKLTPPAAITSLGQSPDAYTARVMARMAKVEIDYNSLLPPDEAKNYKTLIIVVGASLKGFGSAGVNLNTETQRGRNLVEACRKNAVFLVVMHTGGEARREEMSNQLLDTVASKADHLIVLKASDHDGYFTKVAQENNIPLTEVQKNIELKDLFATMFGRN